MKEDERHFLLDLYTRAKPRDLINSSDFYMNHKRAWYLLDKWSNKGWYDYGVTLDLGWLTSKGIAKAEEIISA